jgi:hypothetical protein
VNIAAVLLSVLIFIFHLLSQASSSDMCLCRLLIA